MEFERLEYFGGFILGEIHKIKCYSEMHLHFTILQSAGNLWYEMCIFNSYVGL